MNSFTDAYEFTSEIKETGVEFLFVSMGQYNIIKAVIYIYVLDHQGKKVYNLAFGDYDFKTDSLSDDLTTNNGDPYRVYHTVLFTISRFFQTYEDAMLMVRGSDSTQKFQDNCHVTCKRKCSPAICRKGHRRISIYRNYIDKNFDELAMEYEFFGDLSNDENQILTEEYVKGKKYLKIFLKMRKFNL